MFKVFLANLENKSLKNKENPNVTNEYLVLNFVDYNRKTNQPSGKVRAFWINLKSNQYISEKINELNKNNQLKPCAFYNLDLDLNGNLENINLEQGTK